MMLDPVWVILGMVAVLVGLITACVSLSVQEDRRWDAFKKAHH